jgi:hypothetical protein
MSPTVASQLTFAGSTPARARSMAVRGCMWRRWWPRRSSGVCPLCHGPKPLGLMRCPACAERYGRGDLMLAVMTAEAELAHERLRELGALPAKKARRP